MLDDECLMMSDKCWTMNEKRGYVFEESRRYDGVSENEIEA